MGTLPTQGRFERFVNVLRFIRHNLNTATLRRMYDRRGEGIGLVNTRARLQQNPPASPLPQRPPYACRRLTLAQMNCWPK